MRSVTWPPLQLLKPSRTCLSTPLRSHVSTLPQPCLLHPPCRLYTDRGICLHFSWVRLTRGAALNTVVIIFIHRATCHLSARAQRVRGAVFSAAVNIITHHATYHHYILAPQIHGVVYNIVASIHMQHVHIRAHVHHTLNHLHSTHSHRHPRISIHAQYP